MLLTGSGEVAENLAPVADCIRLLRKRFHWRFGCRTTFTAIPLSQPLFSAFVTTPAHASGRATD